MTRLRILLALVTLSFALGAMPAAFAGGDSPAPDEPVVVVGDEVAPPAEDAWTFRFLVPTLLAMTGLVVAGVALGYGLRIKGRYRVSQ